jgi:mannose-1-phosphate guanylyltransferase
MVAAAMVLSAGLGTRLRPLTDERAKPLVPVGDRAALAHIVDALAAVPLTRIVANAFHRAGDVVEFAERDGRVRVVTEGELLGTAGGLAHASAALGPGDVLVWNGDILASFDVARLVAHAGALATLAVVPRPPGVGNVGFRADGSIVRIRFDHRPSDETHSGDFVGVSVVRAALRRTLPPRGCLVGDVFLPALARGERLVALPIDGAFLDIGSPAAYLEANLAWLNARPPFARRLADGGGAGRGHNVHCALGATVSAAVSAEDVVVGTDARVLGEGELRRVVVWPGATAYAPLADAIVTPRAVVHVTSAP